MSEIVNEASINSKVTFSWKSGIGFKETNLSSMLFDQVGGDRFEVGGGDDLLLGHNNADFTISFEMTRRENPIGVWRNIFHKGIDLPGVYMRSPAMWLNPSNNTLHFRLSTITDTNAGSDTYAEIPLNIKTHIIYMKVGSQLHLYINNVLNRIAYLPSASVSNNDPFSIGGDSHDFYNSAGSELNKFQIHERALSEEDRTIASSGGVVREGLAAYYDFEGTYPFIDRSGNGLHGTVFGTPTQVENN